LSGIRGKFVFQEKGSMSVVEKVITQLHNVDSSKKRNLPDCINKRNNSLCQYLSNNVVIWYLAKKRRKGGTHSKYLIQDIFKWVVVR
jgi:hypothetical protein